MSGPQKAGRLFHGAVLLGMTEQVTVLQRQILPTFRLDTNAELPPENPVPAGVADE